ncbi:MAG: methionyl-tRNA formyltransferase [Christensenellaceae bacterium]|jgi:methionyl-tRNA formyltransferase|nr:methionyl-tRNA formyltransferase [Christensenellaceae bacterium]
MRIIFCGTPPFAVGVLKAILKTEHEIVAVLTKPDKINLRGKGVKFSAVKEYAMQESLPLYQFEKVGLDGYDTIASLKADIMITAAYGKILPESVINLFSFGVINAHASLLPKYRGAAPVQFALLNGDSEVGITIMRTVKEVDAGDVILKKTILLSGDENTEEVLEKLSPIAGNAIIEALDLIFTGKASYAPQNHELATHTTPLKKDEACIEYNSKAIEVINFIRAYAPNPGAYTYTQYGRLKILKAKLDDREHDGETGSVVVVNKEKVVVKCCDGAIVPLIVQGESGKVMTAIDYFRGRRVSVGDKFGRI